MSKMEKNSIQYSIDRDKLTAPMSSSAFTWESNKKCFVCGTNTKVSKHHIKPRSEGGTDSRKNIIYLCEDHHNSLEDKEWSEIQLARKNYIEDSKITPQKKKGKIPIVRLRKGESIAWSDGFNQYTIWKKDEFGLESRVIEEDEILGWKKPD